MTTLETLEMALEALELKCPTFATIVRTGIDDKRDAAIAALRTQIALEKKAENARELGLNYYIPCCKDQTCPKCVAAKQPATWISLTDDEIWDVYKKVDSMQYLEFSRAIEAKLKSKNEHQ